MSVERRAVAFFACAIAAAIEGPVAAHLNAWVGLGATLACAAPFSWLARRLPPSLDGALRRRRRVALAWAFIAIVAIVQMGRLSAFMADSSRVWGSTFPTPLATNHQCLAAYVHAADLCRRGTMNIYDDRWYPAFRGPHGTSAPPMDTPVEGLRPWLEDRYLYPPPFLLLPRAALAVTNSFNVIRGIWFVTKGLVLLVGMAALAAWIGGRSGRIVGLLIPLVLASVPTMIDLQFGQFHAMAVALALGAMVAFEKRQPALGGALLAYATLSKIFPGLLIVMLASRRRWRDIGWTAAFAAAFVLVGLVVLGRDVFAAFLSYQLPRIASGDAYAFLESPDISPLLVSRNLAVSGLVSKLRLLGLPAMTHAASNAVSWAYTLVLLGLAWQGGARAPGRLASAQIWLALLNLAALRAPLAPSGYVVAPTLLLLALVAGEVRGRTSHAVAIGAAWLVAIGSPPLPHTADLLIGLVTQGLVVAINCWVILRSPRTTEETLC